MKKMVVLIACFAITIMGRSVMAAENWFENVQITGYIETQVSFTSTDNEAPVDDVDASDIDLTWMDLWVDAQVHEQVAGHLRFAWQQTDDDHYGEVWLDEGYVKVKGTDTMPVYLLMGRQYVSVGNFATFFVNDPTTLLLGETSEGAAKAGYLFADGTVDVSLGFLMAR